MMVTLLLFFSHPLPPVQDLLDGPTPVVALGPDIELVTGDDETGRNEGETG